MLQVLIAEDEALEKKALRFLLTRLFRESIRIAGEVSNGRDAVQKALLCKPDIVLMDINMPMINGLEAGEQIKEKLPDTEIIILTAFNYFSYMRTAIHLGVSDYLLKPYTDAEFAASVQRAVQKVQQRQRHRSRIAEISRRYEQSTPFIEKEMIVNIVYGMQMEEGKYAEYRKILGISGGRFVCMIARPRAARVGENDVRSLKNRIQELFPEVIGNVCLNDIVLFIFDDRLDDKILSGCFGKVLQSIRKGDGTGEPFPFDVGMGCVNETSGDLYLSYCQAKLELERGNAPAAVPEEKNSGDPDGGDVSRMVRQLSAAVLNEDLEDALTRCDMLLESQFKRSDSHSPQPLRQPYGRILEKIIGNITEFLGDGCHIRAAEIMGDMPDVVQLSDMQLHAHMVLKELIHKISAYKKSGRIDIVDKAKKYIEENFSRDIRLEDIAAHVSISSYYLSRVFKQVEGIHLKDYLIKIRMEKAKNMLKKGNRSIKQVSIDVGYPDQNYFSKAFKKYTRLSPKEYVNS